MPSGRRQFLRCRRSPARSLEIDQLECRALLAPVFQNPNMIASEQASPALISIQPTVQKQRLVVSPKGAVTGMTLSYSEPLDRASAQRLANYDLVVGIPEAGGLETFHNVRPRSVVYDSATQSVRLKFAKPLNPVQSFDIFVDNVKDVAGNVADEFDMSFQLRTR